MSTRITFSPPEADPEHPPTSITAWEIHWEKTGNESMSVVTNPVVVIIDAV